LSRDATRTTTRCSRSRSARLGSISSMPGNKCRLAVQLRKTDWRKNFAESLFAEIFCRGHLFLNRGFYNCPCFPQIILYLRFAENIFRKKKLRTSVFYKPTVSPLTYLTHYHLFRGPML
jgi:hypothetical protein